MATGQIDAVLFSPASVPPAGMAEEPSDGQLLSRFVADRDELAERAFAALVRRHGPMVFRVCQQIVGDRHTAEDAFQATFLILARKAGAINQRDLLGHWLHGVALRTAREARMRNHRRRRRECPSAEVLSGEPVDKNGRPDLLLICREEFEALHEEVARLPERYRIPVVLCDLEGLSYQDAAVRLGCPVATIGVRLKRARERLRTRMTRRGLAPTASLMAALLGAEVASPMPGALVEATARAALGFVSGNAAASGLVSQSVLAVSESVLKTMAFSRLKLITHVALAAGATAAALWVAARSGARTPELPRAASRPAGELAAAQPAVAAQEATRRQPKDDVAAASVPAEKASALATTEIKSGGDGQSVATETAAGTTLASQQKEVSGALPAETASSKSETELAEYARRLLRDEQARGEVLFVKEWVPNDQRSHSGDGLGPVYNETSCVACHGLGAPGGAGPESKNVVLITANLNGCGITTGLEKIHPGFGKSRSAVLHRFGTDPEYASWRRRFCGTNQSDQSNSAPSRALASIDGRIQALKEQTAPDRRLRERSANLPPAGGFSLSLAERNTPALFGVGHIDLIPSEVLVATAASEPEPIRGRVSRTREGRIGRFGWKAQLASLHEFVRGACANELGLEVPGHSQATSPVAPASKPRGLDLTEADCDALVAYVRALPAPVVVDPTGPQGTEDMRIGRALFGEIGCAGCHAPVLGDLKGVYSDLLLHDMGQSLSDSGSSYGLDSPSSPVGPSPREWRTPPLWGYRDSGPYLHDGRAESLAETIALHEGQARASAHRFFGLTSQERGQVEAFLKSLVAPSAAAAPGVALAAEMESAADSTAWHAPETLVRRRREWAVERDVQQFREAQERKRAQEAAKRARVQIPLARSLERQGKIAGAIAFYKEIAKDASGTEEGKLAAERISALARSKGTRRADSSRKD